jgi:meso-butanediol dehydrogenase/(S,S)-butanediol dehydrogenase/diacetyl reductase
LADAHAALLAEFEDERVVPVHADVAQSTAIVGAVASVAGAFGGLDILVNNAAARNHAPLAEADAASWEKLLSVNVVALNECTRAALPHLRASGRGAVVNVSSAFALTGRPGMGQYDATKAAIVAMTRVLAIEEARHGVRVNVVCPGSVLTPFTVGRAAVRGMSEADLRRQGMAPCPLDRWGTAEEIASGILWLASDEASFVTGTTLAIDGGLSATAVLPS